ncbi:MAG TPA: hypothetical protein VIL49_05215, partial [Capillimicrobium sp.]
MSRPLGTGALAAQEAIAALAAQPLEPRELVCEVAARVRRIVPHDWSAWATTDPETLLETDAVVYDPSSDCELTEVQASLELAGGDVNLFADLHRAGTAAATLSGATGGRLEASRRHRDLLAPRGLGDELRLLARSGDAAWATGALARATDAPPFSPDELAFVRAVAGLLGDGLRAGLARGPLAAPDDGPGAGVVLLDGEGYVVSATPEARAWLDRVPSPFDDGYLPPVVELVALRARAGAPGAHARVRVRGGGWLHLRASVLLDAAGAPAETAVTVEPASRAELLPVVVAVHG